MTKVKVSTVVVLLLSLTGASSAPTISVRHWMCPASITDWPPTKPPQQQGAR